MVEMVGALVLGLLALIAALSTGLASAEDDDSVRRFSSQPR